MAKYLVVNPWFGGNVKKGDIVEIEKLHPALSSNVRKVTGDVKGELNPAIASGRPGRKPKGSG